MTAKREPPTIKLNIIFSSTHVSSCCIFSQEDGYTDKPYKMLQRGTGREGREGCKRIWDSKG